MSNPGIDTYGDKYHPKPSLDLMDPFAERPVPLPYGGSITPVQHSKAEKSLPRRILNAVIEAIAYVTSSIGSAIHHVMEKGKVTIAKLTPQTNKVTLAANLALATDLETKEKALAEATAILFKEYEKSIFVQVIMTFEEEKILHPENALVFSKEGLNAWYVHSAEVTMNARRKQLAKISDALDVEKKFRRVQSKASNLLEFYPTLGKVFNTEEKQLLTSNCIKQVPEDPFFEKGLDKAKEFFAVKNAEIKKTFASTKLEELEKNINRLETLQKKLTEQVNKAPAFIRSIFDKNDMALLSDSSLSVDSSEDLESRLVSAKREIDGKIAALENAFVQVLQLGRKIIQLDSVVREHNRSVIRLTDVKTEMKKICTQQPRDHQFELDRRASQYPWLFDSLIHSLVLPLQSKLRRLPYFADLKKECDRAIEQTPNSRIRKVLALNNIVKDVEKTLEEATAIKDSFLNGFRENRRTHIDALLALIPEKQVDGKKEDFILEQSFEGIFGVDNTRTLAAIERDIGVELGRVAYDFNGIEYQHGQSHDSKMAISSFKEAIKSATGLEENDERFRVIMDNLHQGIFSPLLHVASHTLQDKQAILREKKSLPWAVNLVGPSKISVTFERNGEKKIEATNTQFLVDKDSNLPYKKVSFKISLDFNENTTTFSIESGKIA